MSTLTLWRETTDKIGCKKTLNVFIPLRNGQIVRKTSCFHIMTWVAGVCFVFFNTCVFKLSFSEIEEACFNKSRVRGVCRHGVLSGFRLAISSPMVPGKQCVMFWMRTSRLAWSAHGLKGFIVFWQRGRWQRSVPVNNVPILWRFSASPEICRVLKKLVYPEGWSACDTVFCPLPLHSWVTGGGGGGVGVSQLSLGEVQVDQSPVYRRADPPTVYRSLFASCERHTFWTCDLLALKKENVFIKCYPCPLIGKPILICDCQPPSGGFLHCIVFILSHVVIEHIALYIISHCI